MSVVEGMIAVAVAAVAAVLLDVAVSGGGAISELETVSQLALAAVLAAYLYYRHVKRTRQLERSWRIPSEPNDWTGKGFDASGITPRIAEVRKNYLPEKPALQSHFHRGLLAFARDAVSRFGFFRDRGHAAAHDDGAQRQ